MCFFKQKTAYERRISDWSSDVCSSDLAVRETQVQFAPFDVDYGAFTGCAINVVTKSGTNDYHFGGFFEYSDNGLRSNSVAGEPVPPIEIGRASSRERVGQYV